MKKGLILAVGGLTIAGLLIAKNLSNSNGLETKVTDAPKQSIQAAFEQSYAGVVLSYDEIAKKHQKATGHPARLDVINDWENYLKQDISEVERVKVLYNIGVHGKALSPHRYRKEFERAIEAFRQVANQTVLPTYRDDAYLQMGDAYSQLGKYREAKECYGKGLALGGDMKNVLEKRVEDANYHIQRTQR